MTSDGYLMLKCVAMRQNIFAISLFTFAIIAYGQDPKTGCATVTLIAPDYSYPWNSVRISAEVGKAPIKGDWLVVKENFRSKKIETGKIKGAEFVEVNAWQTNDSGSITAVISIPPSPNCGNERTAAVSVTLTENPGTPWLIDEFGKLSLSDEKGRLDNIAASMQERPEHELLIFLNFGKSDTGAHKMLRRYVAHLSGLRKLPIHRITFLLENTDYFSSKFQSVPQNLVNVYASGFLEIKAERFGEYERLFR